MDRPNDVRGFIHKRIFGGIKGAIGGLLRGGPLGAIGGAASGFLAGGDRAVPGGSRGCPPGFQLTARGCQAAPRVSVVPVPGVRGFFERLVPGGATGLELERPITSITGRAASLAPRDDDFGDAVVGRFGAAIEPAIRETETRVCPRGAVLGQDGLCYNRRDLRNSERFWPRGRRPLLTGGEMRCISVASSAAKKLQRKQKQLEALGMLKRPARRAAPRQLAAGHHEHVAHD